MVNVKPEIINKYENGSAIPDSKVLQKLRKALGTRLKVT
jgi:ribosome-binding protein aMBF1 (putative translation factor)